MIARVLALAAFALRTNLRLRATRIGAVAALLILLLGPVISLTTGEGWELDPSLGFYALLVALIFGLRSGLEQQREDDLALFLTHNLVTPLEHAIGMVLSLLGTWLLVLAATFFGLVVVSLGDVDTAAWHTAAWGLRSAVIIGFVPLVERVASLRMPVVLPAFAYLLTMITVSILVGEEAALELFVITSRDEPATLLRLGAQAAATFTFATAAFLLLTIVLGRRGRAPARARPGRRW